ncbi:MAG TPA: hypothetical protein VEK07_09110 [Polyangiaceae bacterium]|nr:hypothetical protein [Polyangiaceae bacterium]
MRRTFQDLARDAGVEKSVRKAVCGHATDAMSDHYSTVRLEMRAAVSKVFGAVAGPEKGLRSGIGSEAAQ